MGITARFDANGARRKMLAVQERIDRAVVQVLRRLGEEVVRHAKDRPGAQSWYDQTGALRNSIGYIITHRGRTVATSGFAGNGSGSGRALARRVARDHAGARYTLIIVAGMHYAVYVEAMASKDVLASAELYAERRLPLMIDQLARAVARHTSTE